MLASFTRSKALSFGQNLTARCFDQRHLHGIRLRNPYCAHGPTAYYPVDIVSEKIGEHLGLPQRYFFTLPDAATSHLPACTLFSAADVRMIAVWRNHPICSSSVIRQVGYGLLSVHHPPPPPRILFLQLERSAAHNPTGLFSACQRQ